MGLVGAVVTMKWSEGLIRETGSILLDRSADRQIKIAIISALEADKRNKVKDLQVWKVSQYHLCANISLVSDDPQPPEYYKKLLAHIRDLAHLFVEVKSVAVRT